MGKKVGGTFFVCLVAIAIVTAVVLLIATSQDHEGCGKSEEEDFFCCKELKTKLPRSQVGISQEALDT